MKPSGGSSPVYIVTISEMMSQRLETYACELTHLGAGDEFEFGDSLGVEEVHAALGLVVGSNTEGDDFETVKARSHLEDLTGEQELVKRVRTMNIVPAVVGVVEVLVLGRVRHASGVAADDVEVGTSVEAGLGVPLDFCGSSVHHRAREDGEHGVLGLENTLVHDGVVLLHADGKWHIIGLGPASERVKEQHRVLEPTLEELAASVLHEEGVAIVDWVAQLEGVHGIGFSLLELSAELVGGEAVLVEAIAPGDLVKNLKGSADKEVSSREDLLNVRVASVGSTPLTAASLLLAGLKELGVPHDGDVLAFIGKGDGGLVEESLALVLGGRADDGHRLVDRALWCLDEVVVHGLEEFLLGHEALEGSSPSLGEDLEPLHGELVHGKLGKSSSLGGLGSLHGLVNEELIDGDSGGGNNALLLQELDDLGNAVGDVLALATDSDVGVDWGLVDTVNTGETWVIRQHRGYYEAGLTLDLASTGLLVQTLRVTLLADIERCGDVALKELETGRVVELTDVVTVSDEG